MRYLALAYLVYSVTTDLAIWGGALYYFFGGWKNEHTWKNAPRLRGYPHNNAGASGYSAIDFNQRDDGLNENGSHLGQEIK